MINRLQKYTLLSKVQRNKMNLFGNYEFEYNLIDVATVLRAYEPYASLAAISRASGINQHLLSHYANRMKQPRPQQRQRIVDAFHKIGRELMAVV